MTKDEALEILEENLRRAKINDSIGYDRQERKAHNNYKELLTVSIEALKAQKFGVWIKAKAQHIKTGEIRPVRECSECFAGYFVYDTFNSLSEVPKFCPNCGAKMEGGGL